ncbi:hypothetical protein AAHN97_00390 [Chitinophaga niabensis]|uniref:hypothetical protein n=1 Tax=Chitinophaga niabensis TaxID=536979 RepID=UPI0031BA5F35
MLQTFSKGLVLAEFMMNRDYIAKVLCINKAKPQLACHGQCQLMKQMEKETKKEQNGNALKDKYEVVFAVINTSFHLSPSIAVKELFTAYNGGAHRDPLHAVFHPPQA